MPQPVPLGAHLRVERPDVVVDGPRLLVDELMVEDGAREIRRLAARVEVQRAVRRDAHTGADLLRRGQHARGRQSIQRAELVSCAIEAPGGEIGVSFPQGEGRERGNAVFV